MKQIAMYEADDGSRWKTAEEATARDAVLRAVEEAMAPLGPRPDFGPHDGYWPHTAEAIRKAKCSLLWITRGILPELFGGRIRLGMKFPDDFVAADPGWYLRILDGTCTPLELAWGRMWSIDAEGHEWNQPYFALNPGKGIGIDLAKAQEKPHA